MNKRILNKRLDGLFKVLGILTTVFGMLVLLVLFIDVFLDGASRLSLGFFTSFPSRKPEAAGILSAWVGTLWIMAVTAFIAIPLGIGSAIYLEEYAPKNRLTALIEISIANLAGVPSVIFGLLGLGLFVRWFNLDRSVLAGGLTLAILVLPVIILSTREALRAIPFSIREASYAVGATKWQTVYLQVLPAALGNIMTGVILAMSRAVGETAPLITIGALTYIAFLPQPPVILSGEFPFIRVGLQGLFDPFTALPIQIFNWVSRPQKGFSVNASAGIIVLLGITLAMNSIAVIVRYRQRKKTRW
ncbi:MAG: phosphate ABC transporter, permease protein PstA [Omnitrophica WOR_2 bacterium GWF2_43_52]|nr:MAG: phosphate ABC transporter, permease protein PstA [Omnitrophica WOR_2 bacterium GWF2_43_52]HBG63377.1 phosphate ABC transporter permease PtsA [Candidatus Omnitrophota bacterium]